MGQALYRKYRSKSLGEILGQEHITETLRRAIETGRISHAYLFTGPRGVGKTSIARILAHELNGVPYNGEDNHLDIIEIDAASNGGVDEIRDLRDKVYIAPSAGKFKVYIIDEVHMMTTSAFNALLKTLEEPPAHAVFILATTEAHKLPATIISRTQRFTFKPIDQAKVVAHLRYIAEQEKIDIDSDALALIAEHGEGSFRDSISMLDQASSAGSRIDRAAVEQLLGIPPVSITADLLAQAGSHDTANLVTLLARLRTDGYQASALSRQLGQSLRAQLMAGAMPFDRDTTLTLLRRLIDVPASHNPDQLLELVLLEAALVTADTAPAMTVQPAPAPVTTMLAAPRPKAAKTAIKEPEPLALESEKPAATTVATLTAELKSDDDAPAGTITVTNDAWQTLLDALKKQYNTLYGIIRMARPEFKPGQVELTFGYAFHQKRANDAKNKKILTALLEEITGERIAVHCKYDKTVTPPAPTLPAAIQNTDPAAPLSAISNIFGGGEVLKP